MNKELHIYPNIEHLSKKFKGILLDAYGVFWGGNEFGMLPGALNAMEKLVSDGKIVGILSNTTQLAQKEKEKLKKHGVIEGEHFHFFISSGDVASSIFMNQELPFPTPNRKFFLSDDAHPKFSPPQAIFQDSSFQETKKLTEADFIYAAIPHINGEDQIDVGVFREKIATFMQHPLPMVCVNPDRFAHEGNPPKAVVRQGSIAELYEEMGGSVFHIGKPSTIAYTYAMKHFYEFDIRDPTQILMVGDTPETDIRGARNFGMSSALITKTGIMSERINHHGLEKALKCFPAHDYPDYFIERLN